MRVEETYGAISSHVEERYKEIDWWRQNFRIMYLTGMFFTFVLVVALTVIVHLPQQSTGVLPLKRKCQIICSVININKPNKPHCGSDGVTYLSKCHLDMAMCKNQTLKKKHRGSCDSTHAGYCPTIQNESYCSQNRCNEDKECSLEEKCCTTRKCGNSCVKACDSKFAVCPTSCPSGQKNKLKLNKSGCFECTCKKKFRCIKKLCPHRCHYGYLRDKSGCSTCACKRPNRCQVNDCFRKCLHGYMINSYGCRTCVCRPRPSCPRPRCPLTCKPDQRRFVRLRTGCYGCFCLPFRVDPLEPII
eukprot:gene3550-4053_t